MSYQEEYDRSMNDPAGFWRTQAEALEWFTFPTDIVSIDDDGLGHWFADGEMNTAYMALDHHVKSGRGDQAALIYDSLLPTPRRATPTRSSPMRWRALPGCWRRSVSPKAIASLSTCR